MTKHCASCNVIKSNRTSYRKVDWPGKLPGSWNRTWSKQYVSAVHPMTFFFLQRQTLHINSNCFILSAFAASVRCRYSIFSSLPCNNQHPIKSSHHPVNCRLHLSNSRPRLTNTTLSEVPVWPTSTDPQLSDFPVLAISWQSRNDRHFQQAPFIICS